MAARRRTGLTGPREPAIRCLPPLADEHPIVHNYLLAEGYAVARAGIDRVQLEVDGRTYAADYGLWSEHAAADFPRLRGAARAGFRATVDTSGWPAGSHEITVRAVDRRGREAEIRRTVEVAPYEPPPPSIEELAELIRSGRTALVLESPLDEAGIAGSGYFEVVGWAYCERGLERIVVTIPGSARFEANRDLARPDLAGLIEGVDLTGAGFRARIDARPLNPGEHYLTVAALGADGTAMGSQVRIRVLAEGEPAVLPPPLPESAGEIDEALYLVGAPSAAAPAEPRPEAWAAEPRPERLTRARLADAEREARYRLAAQLAPGRRALDLGSTEPDGAGVLRAAGASGVERVDREAAIVEPLSLEFEDASFGLATCFELLERLEDPEAAVAELRRVLVPDGLVLVACANPAAAPAGDPSRRSEIGPRRLEELLAAGFGEVRLLRQSTQVASSVLDDERFGVVGPEIEIDSELRKMSGAAPGEELFTLALAGQVAPPELRPVTVLSAADFEITEWHRLAAAWEERARWAQAHADASRAAAAHAWLQVDYAHETLEATHASLSWRLTRPLRAVKGWLRRQR